MIARLYVPVALLGLALGSVALAGCGSSAPNRPSATGSAQRSVATLAKQYLAIAEPANEVLDKSFDALEDDNDDDLAASSALLRTIVATERSFDRDLLTLKLPPAMRQTALELVRVNEARADFTARAATATSVASLRRYEPDLDAMNAPVEEQVRLLRMGLGLPPPATD